MTTEIKSHIRDINLDILLNKNNFEIDVSKRYKNKIRLFYPNQKLINYITKVGGVLTGSRALRCYTLDKNTILDRDSEDWDFIITLDMAYKIFNFKKINNIPKIGDVISIKDQRYWRHPDYSEAYRVGPVDIQLIISDKLPLYKEKNNIRISDISYSINYKLKMIDEIENTIHSGYYNDTKFLKDKITKHTDDIKSIIIKINSIKNEI